jgi:surface protein
MFNPQYYFRPESKEFVFTVKTDNAGVSATNQFQLPIYVGGAYNFRVLDSSDNLLATVTSGASPVIITLPSVGTHQLKIRGTIIGWRFANTGDRLKFMSVEKWGQLRLGNLGNYFQGCANLDLSGVSDVLDLTGTTSLANMFSGCSILSTVNKMNEWSTSAVTNMNLMFFNCTAFNQNIGNWNTSLVDNMSGLFRSATAFNQNIGSWNLSSVTNMQSLLQSATNFNQPIGNWNVSNVTNMLGIFFTATSFNQNIGSWNVSGVSDFSQSFQLATAFNNGGSSDINNWNTSSVTNMNSMFSGATAFNQNIGSWNVSNVTSIGSFMANKTAANYSSANMDAILNGWIVNELKPTLGNPTTFGTIARTIASNASRLLMGGVSTTKAVTNAIDNGSGLIRITAIGHGLTTADKCFIKSILGTTEANGLATVTVIDVDNFDIDGSTFTNAYISGGTVITQYGWLGLPI